MKLRLILGCVLASVLPSIAGAEPPSSTGTTVSIGSGSNGTMALLLEQYRGDGSIVRWPSKGVSPNKSPNQSSTSISGFIDLSDLSESIAENQIAIQIGQGATAVNIAGSPGRSEATSSAQDIPHCPMP